MGTSKRRLMKRRLLPCAAAAILLAALCGALIRWGGRAALAREYSAHVLAEQAGSGDYIKWVDFNVPLSVLEHALQYDLQSHGRDVKLDWITLLAACAAQNGGQWKESRDLARIDAFAGRLQAEEPIGALTADLRYYDYYLEAYTAVLGGFVGEYPAADGKPAYGLRAYSPIARGYGFGHYQDFGAARTYGYKRLHLGNDLMGAVGTPIVAVEGGVVEALGWNEYGGWRVGIRSHDGLRYWYYAHLRKDHPYFTGLAQGDTVEAGDVIGYMGMTGYSKEENVNNIEVPHLHFGLQLIFDESQKDGENQIWVDVYDIVELLQRNRMPVAQAGDDWSRAEGRPQA